MQRPTQCWSEWCLWVVLWVATIMHFLHTHTHLIWILITQIYDRDFCNISPHTCCPSIITAAICIHTDEFSRLTSKCEFWVVFHWPLFACLPCLLFARCVFWEWILHSLDLHKLHGPIQAAMDRLLWFLQTSFAVVHNEQSGGYFTQISLPWAYKSQWPHLSWGIYPAKLMAHG